MVCIFFRILPSLYKIRVVKIIKKEIEGRWIRADNSQLKKLQFDVYYHYLKVDFVQIIRNII